MNLKRIVIGGLLAGLWINIVEMIVHGYVLAPRYEALVGMGIVHKAPQLPFEPLFGIIMLVVGIFLAWLYAAARDTLKPGALTAIKIGFVAAFLAAVPGNVADATWYTAGKLIPFVTMVAIFVEGVSGTLIAGALYKPKA